MVHSLWNLDSRTHIVCIDSYENGILQGRFFRCWAEPVSFSSLSQFLIGMDQMLEEAGAPQADTQHRSFSHLLSQDVCHPSEHCRGSLATFELQVRYRQHSSWQGSLVWKEGRREQSFRSTLELVLLMDSALRGDKEDKAG